MTAERVLVECERRGIRLVETDGRLRYRAPRGSLTVEIRTALARHKGEVLDLLRQLPLRKTDAQASDHFDYAEAYARLTADIATLEDVDALRWAVEHHDRNTLAELLALDRECARLAQADEVDEFRTAVARFVNRVRELRRLYRQHAGS